MPKQLLRFVMRAAIKISHNLDIWESVDETDFLHYECT